MEIVLLLVRNGFSHDEVLNELTFMQVREYYRIYSKENNDNLIQNATAMRIAFHADAKDFERMCKGK